MSDLIPCPISAPFYFCFKGGQLTPVTSATWGLGGVLACDVDGFGDVGGTGEHGEAGTAEATGLVGATGATFFRLLGVLCSLVSQDLGFCPPEVSDTTENEDKPNPHEQPSPFNTFAG